MTLTQRRVCGPLLQQQQLTTAVQVVVGSCRPAPCCQGQQAQGLAAVAATLHVWRP